MRRTHVFHKYEVFTVVPRQNACLSLQCIIQPLNKQVSHDAKGVLGETFVPTRDASGKPIMTGMEAIRGTQEDCKYFEENVSVSPCSVVQRLCKNTGFDRRLMLVSRLFPFLSCLFADRVEGALGTAFVQDAHTSLAE